MAKVRGIFYTISAFFLVTLVVTLSILLVTTLQQSNSRLYESGSLERVYDLDTSLERTISNLDNGIILDTYWDDTVNETVVSFEENLDSGFSSYGSNFYSEMLDIINFVENDQPEIEFDISKVYNSTERIPLFVKPTNLKYTHIISGSENLILVDPGSSLPVRAFSEIDLITASIGSGIVWTTQNPGDDFLFNLTVRDSFGGVDSEQQLLNLSKVNTFRINNGVNVTIGNNCVGCITINRNGINITSNLDIYLPFTSEEITINYPPGLYTIDFPELKIYVNSSPRIL